MVTRKTSAPLLDKLLGDATGHILAWLGKRALRRGDRHEFDHILAAVTSGNSELCTPGHCALHRPATTPPPPPSA